MTRLRGTPRDRLHCRINRDSDRPRAPRLRTRGARRWSDSIFVMRQFFGGMFFISGLLVAFGAFAQDSFATGIPWGLGALVLAAIGLALSQNRSQPDDPTQGEDLHAKENNRQVALQVADSGGMLGSTARLWLKAYDTDPSVPIFGVRPYWTPTGPGGTPQLLSTIGLRGLDGRLRYVGEVEAGDSLLPIMADDPHPRVRDAARARLR